MLSHTCFHTNCRNSKTNFNKKYFFSLHYAIFTIDAIKIITA